MRTTLGLACLLLATATPAWPADDAIEGWQLQWENDVWARGHTDRWYTNGIRLSWTFKELPDNAPSRLFLAATRWLQWNDGAGPTESTGKNKPKLAYTIGQSMYTPQNITLSSPQPDDRPWGAFLYFGASTNATRDLGDVWEFRSTELKLGTTGTDALGEAAQEFVHKLTSSAQPQGWNQQLRNRLGIQLSHARVRLTQDHIGRDFVAFQYGWGVALGTLRNHANVNVAMLVGTLGNTNSPLPIGNEGDFVTADFNNRKMFEQPFGYVAANLTGVASNYFIEGRTPYGRSHLEARRSYTMVQAGVSFPLQRWLGKRWPRLVYAQSSRSPEFRNTTTGRDSARQRWGTLAAHWDIDD